ncbi:four-helix bundle copper-binding protein [Bacillus sp. JZ8]
MRECIKIDRQCAMFVSLTMKTIELEGSFIKETCEFCAKECEKHDYPHCKECIQACKVCTEACRELVA